MSYESDRDALEVSVSDSESTRWKLEITPVGEECRVVITAYAGDVSAAEVAHFVAKAVVLFSSPSEVRKRIPTEQEVMAQRERQLLLQAHPAVRLFVRDGRQVWLGEEALRAVTRTEESECTTIATLSERLLSAGWTDAGPAPEGVTRVCDYASDPAGLLASL